jgi:hypothetical protein
VAEVPFRRHARSISEASASMMTDREGLTTDQVRSLSARPSAMIRSTAAAVDRHLAPAQSGYQATRFECALVA